MSKESKTSLHPLSELIEPKWQESELALKELIILIESVTEAKPFELLNILQSGTDKLKIFFAGKVPPNHDFSHMGLDTWYAAKNIFHSTFNLKITDHRLKYSILTRLSIIYLNMTLFFDYFPAIDKIEFLVKKLQLLDLQTKDQAFFIHVLFALKSCAQIEWKIENLQKAKRWLTASEFILSQYMLTRHVKKFEETESLVLLLNKIELYLKLYPNIGDKYNKIFKKYKEDLNLDNDHKQPKIECKLEISQLFSKDDPFKLIIKLKNLFDRFDSMFNDFLKNERIHELIDELTITPEILTHIDKIICLKTILVNDIEGGIEKLLKNNLDTYFKKNSYNLTICLFNVQTLVLQLIFFLETLDIFNKFFYLDFILKWLDDYNPIVGAIGHILQKINYFHFQVVFLSNVFLTKKKLGKEDSHLPLSILYKSVLDFEPQDHKQAENWFKIFFEMLTHYDKTPKMKQHIEKFTMKIALLKQKFLDMLIIYPDCANIISGLAVPPDKLFSRLIGYDPTRNNCITTKNLKQIFSDTEKFILDLADKNKIDLDTELKKHNKVELLQSQEEFGKISLPMKFLYIIFSISQYKLILENILENTDIITTEDESIDCIKALDDLWDNIHIFLQSINYFPLNSMNFLQDLCLYTYEISAIRKDRALHKGIYLLRKYFLLLVTGERELITNFSSLFQHYVDESWRLENENTLKEELSSWLQTYILVIREYIRLNKIDNFETNFKKKLSILIKKINNYLKKNTQLGKIYEKQFGLLFHQLENTDTLLEKFVSRKNIIESKSSDNFIKRFEEILKLKELELTEINFGLQYFVKNYRQIPNNGIIKWLSIIYHCISKLNTILKEDKPFISNILFHSLFNNIQFYECLLNQIRFLLLIYRMDNREQITKYGTNILIDLKTFFDSKQICLAPESMIIKILTEVLDYFRKPFVGDNYKLRIELIAICEKLLGKNPTNLYMMGLMISIRDAHLQKEQKSEPILKVKESKQAAPGNSIDEWKKIKQIVIAIENFINYYYSGFPNPENKSSILIESKETLINVFSRFEDSKNDTDSLIKQLITEFNFAKPLFVNTGFSLAERKEISIILLKLKKAISCSKIINKQTSKLWQSELLNFSVLLFNELGPDNQSVEHSVLVLFSQIEYYILDQDFSTAKNFLTELWLLLLRNHPTLSAYKITFLFIKIVNFYFVLGDETYDSNFKKLFRKYSERGLKKFSPPAPRKKEEKIKKVLLPQISAPISKPKVREAKTFNIESHISGLDTKHTKTKDPIDNTSEIEIKSSMLDCFRILTGPPFLFEENLSLKLKQILEFCELYNIAVLIIGEDIREILINYDFCQFSLLAAEKPLESKLRNFLINELNASENQKNNFLVSWKTGYFSLNINLCIIDSLPAPGAIINSYAAILKKISTTESDTVIAGIFYHTTYFSNEDTAREYLKNQKLEAINSSKYFCDPTNIISYFRQLVTSRLSPAEEDLYHIKKFVKGLEIGQVSDNRMLTRVILSELEKIKPIYALEFLSALISENLFETMFAVSSYHRLNSETAINLLNTYTFTIKDLYQLLLVGCTPNVKSGAIFISYAYLFLKYSVNSLNLLAICAKTGFSFPWGKFLELFTTIHIDKEFTIEIWQEIKNALTIILFNDQAVSNFLFFLESKVLQLFFPNASYLLTTSQLAYRTIVKELNAIATHQSADMNGVYHCLIALEISGTMIKSLGRFPPEELHHGRYKLLYKYLPKCFRNRISNLVDAIIADEKAFILKDEGEYYCVETKRVIISDQNTQEIQIRQKKLQLVPDIKGNWLKTSDSTNGAVRIFPLAPSFLGSLSRKTSKGDPLATEIFKI